MNTGGEQMFADETGGGKKRRALMLSETEGINRDDEEEVRRAKTILAGRSWKEVGREMA